MREENSYEDRLYGNLGSETIIKGSTFKREETLLSQGLRMNLDIPILIMHPDFQSGNLCLQ